MSREGGVVGLGHLKVAAPSDGARDIFDGAAAGLISM